MALIPAGYSQVNLRFTGVYLPNGAEMVFGVDNTVGATPDAIALDVENAWVTADMDANQTDGVTLSSILVKNGPNSTGPSAERGVSSTGDKTTPGWGPQVSFLIRKSTALGGRRGRGRMYMPGGAEADINGAGQIEAATLTALQTDCTAFLNALLAADCPMVLLHSDATTPTLVTALTVDATAATQRRRLRG